MTDTAPPPEPIYVAARGVLLDALEALAPQADAIVVVGAQAVYLRTGTAGIAFAPLTSDADLAIEPSLLVDDPLLEELMLSAGFFASTTQPGSWAKSVLVGTTAMDIPVDLMVPEALVPAAGRRGARIPPHSRTATRKTPGLEAAVVDNGIMTIEALDTADDRRIDVRVAGPTALLVAKLHKLGDRSMEEGSPRLNDKDAADVYRLMQSTPVGSVNDALRRLLDDPVAAGPTERAVVFLVELFGRPGSQGVLMAIAALEGAVPQDRVWGVCAAFVAGVEGTS